MSDAKVTFSKLDYEDAAPGEECRFNFACPRHKGRRCSGLLIEGRTGLKRDPEGKNGGAPHWGWDGNRERPTFKPSVDCKRCWHGYVEKGRCVDTSHNEEPDL